MSESQIIRQDKLTKLGRSGLNDDVITTFQITGMISTDLNLRNEAQQINSLFILGINDLSDEICVKFILDECKSQQAIEGGFQFLKSPDFLTSSLF